LALLRAAAEAAENWGAYVTVHVCAPRAVRQAIEAGIKCIDHGHLLDDPAKNFLVMMKNGKIYKNLQK
jgi:imidazolonepropionase-like amidohydrolase